VNHSGHGGAWAVIGGGGTGGHVIPAVAIAKALVARGHPAGSIRFIGSSRGLESSLVPEAGFEVDLLPGRGIARRLTLENIGALTGLARATLMAVRLFGRLKPAVVVSVGGYASAPCVVAAVAWRVPLIVAEQNAVPGVANRIAGRFARSCAVSFPGTRLPNAVVTGNPVRPAIAAVDRSAGGRGVARAELGVPQDSLLVVAAGGSLGARSINEAVLGLAGLWADRAGVVIRHVVGRRDFADVSARAPAPVVGGLLYQQQPFESRMELLLAAADVMVQRAGASTVAELATAGVPAILVPLPGAPGDHQTRNAQSLSDAGAAILVEDRDLSPALLAELLERLLGDVAKREEMGQAAKRLARPQAADDVAALAERYARGRG
jgi:undecaprenyldiphospho-muramoylpentapeptide beta-N-acetylglucosaminyltransferase